MFGGKIKGIYISVFVKFVKRLCLRFKKQFKKIFIGSKIRVVIKVKEKFKCMVIKNL